jgi:hypothetical protein
MCGLVVAARKMLALGLMFVLTASLAADSVFARPAANEPRDQAGDVSRLREQVVHLPAGELIEVRLVSREKVHGRLGVVELDSFALKLHDAASERRIAFADVKSVKSIPSARASVVGWIVAGVAIGVVVVALAVYLAFRHNEGV